MGLSYSRQKRTARQPGEHSSCEKNREHVEYRKVKCYTNDDADRSIAVCIGKRYYVYSGWFFTE